jgi:tetratricopeptide (TPR) repeat protein
MGQVFTFDRQHNNPAGQLKIAEAMILQYPQIPAFYTYAGNLNTQLGNYAQAAFYFRKLYMLNRDTTLPQNIFKLYLEADDPVNALKYVGSSASPKEFTPVLTEIINDETRLKTTPGNTTLTRQIAADYHQLGLDNVKLN